MGLGYCTVGGLALEQVIGKAQVFAIPDDYQSYVFWTKKPTLRCYKKIG